jgi:Fe-S cluster assembly iron-binding protein IscA
VVAADDAVIQRLWYIVLTITPMAADAIKAILSSSPVPEGGLKIATRPVSDTESAFELSVVEAPADTDSVVEEQGSRVFVEDAAAPYLDGKVLDAEVEAGQVRFRLQDQTP